MSPRGPAALTTKLLRARTGRIPEAGLAPRVAAMPDRMSIADAILCKLLLLTSTLLVHVASTAELRSRTRASR